MDKKEYFSLKLIHKIREENYKRTKSKKLEEVIEESIKEGLKIARKLNLKIKETTRKTL